MTTPSSSSSGRRPCPSMSQIVVGWLSIVSVTFRPQVAVDCKTQMFDLIVDSTEAESTHGDATYDDVKLYMESRIPSYWINAMVEPDNSDNPGESVIMAQWDNCHSTCPWTQNSAHYDIDHIYLYPNAPHIVFILVDDWGYNDVGYRSTSMTWTTPMIDKLASEGIILNNYFTHETCTPSRGALMTGRQAVRLGLSGAADEFGPELPLSEVTLAQELKSAGYKTNLIGKWHLGMSSSARTPTFRGFDYFYGFYNSYIDYWTKTYQGYIDLHENLDAVLDAVALDDNLFSQHLFQEKAEKVISEHAKNYPTDPMFLLYSMQVVHAPYEVPAEYSARCTADGSLLDDDNYCGMIVLLDEAVANITCALEANGMSDNTVLIVTSANGGASTGTAGTNVPYRGYKGDYYRGALSVNAFVHSPLIPVNARGTSYDGQMHVTDWLPTLMGLATKNTWTGSIAGPEIVIDGKDMWTAMTTGDESPRHEILHYIKDEETFSIQYDMVKLDFNNEVSTFGSVSITYATDFDPERARYVCPAPTLMLDSTGGDILGSDDYFGGPSPSPTPKASAAPTYPNPTLVPTAAPSWSMAPTAVEETNPPSLKPVAPSAVPSLAPVATSVPSASPTIAATFAPTDAPITAEPSAAPSDAPSEAPTSAAPSPAPTKATPSPTAIPTAPTFRPSTMPPTYAPSVVPTLEPSGVPTEAPTKRFDLKLFVSHNLSYLIVGVVIAAWAVFFLVRFCPCCTSDEDDTPVSVRPVSNDKTPLLRSPDGKLINNRVTGGNANAASYSGSEMGFLSGWWPSS